MNSYYTHPSIQKIQETIANRPKLPMYDDTPPKLLDPPLFNKAAKLLHPPSTASLQKKITPKSIKPIKAIPKPHKPTKPTKVPTKFSLNHTTTSWKP
jgi:hypothetical protein